MNFLTFDNQKDFKVYVKTERRFIRISEYVYNILNLWDHSKDAMIFKDAMLGLIASNTDDTDMVKAVSALFGKLSHSAISLLKCKARVDVLNSSGYGFTDHALIRLIARFYDVDVVELSNKLCKPLIRAYKEKEEFIVAGDVGIRLNPNNKVIITMYKASQSDMKVNGFKSSKLRKRYLENKNLFKILSDIKKGKV